MIDRMRSSAPAISGTLSLAAWRKFSRGGMFRLALIVLLVAIVLYLGKDGGESVLRMVREYNFRSLPGAILLFLAVYAATVFLVPSFAFLCAASGYHFGLLAGVMLVSFASIAGAVSAYLLARWSRWRNRIGRWAERKRLMLIVEEDVRHASWPAVFAIRFCPFFPNRVLNYVFGLLDMPPGPFIAGTWLGTIPIIVVYTWIGTMFRKLPSVKEIRTIAMQKDLYMLAVLAALVALNVIVRIGRKRKGS